MSSHTPVGAPRDSTPANRNSTDRANFVSATRSVSVENAKVFLKLLAPFAPFITEEIWRNVFNEKESIHLSGWPEADRAAAKAGVVKIPVQVDGKVRAIIMINDQLSTLNQEKIVEIALKDPKVKKWVEGKKYKVIYVKGKILNFVITG